MEWGHSILERIPMSYYKEWGHSFVEEKPMSWLWSEKPAILDKEPVFLNFMLDMGQQKLPPLLSAVFDSIHYFVFSRQQLHISDTYGNLIITFSLFKSVPRDSLASFTNMMLVKSLFWDIRCKVSWRCYYCVLANIVTAWISKQ